VEGEEAVDRQVGALREDCVDGEGARVVLVVRLITFAFGSGILRFDVESALGFCQAKGTCQQIKISGNFVP